LNSPPWWFRYRWRKPQVYCRCRGDSGRLDQRGPSLLDERPPSRSAAHVALNSKGVKWPPPDQRQLTINQQTISVVPVEKRR
jgi:hypothetical protein